MVNNDQLDQVFQALSDSTRRQMIECIAAGNPTVGELAEPFAISAPAISRHLKVLEQADLIERRREGRTVRFQINEKPLQDAQIVMQKLTNLWLGRLSRLAEVLDEEL